MCLLSNKLWREYIYIWVTFVEQRALLVRAYTRTMAMSISPSPRARHSRGWICGMLISPSNTLYWKCIRFVTAVWHIHTYYILNTQQFIQSNSFSILAEIPISFQDEYFFSSTHSYRRSQAFILPFAYRRLIVKRATHHWYLSMGKWSCYTRA